MQYSDQAESATSGWYKSMVSQLVVDARLMTSLLIGAVKEQERIYGPVFSKMVARYSTEFESKKINDPSPPPIERIEDCANYITENTDKYPDGFSAIIYGTAKAESMLQGGIGSGARTTAKDAMKGMAKKSGTATLYGKTIHSLEALKKHLDFSRKLHTLMGEPTLSGDENTVLAKIDGCHLGDGCKAVAEENIRKVGGTTECAFAVADSAILEIITSSIHDYELLEFNPPHCTFRIFKVQ